MKRMYKFIVIFGVMFSLFACHNEDSLTPGYEYEGPVPAITDGPSEAQKICYELYKTYDLHVYYTLAGDEALQSIVGPVSENIFSYSGVEGTYPVQAGDEVTSTVFLKLMKKFYETLPEELAKSAAKRQVLIKVGTNMDLMQSAYDQVFYGEVEVAGSGFVPIGITTEAQKGVVYWGDMNDKIGIQPDVWKYSLCAAFFEVRASNYYYTELPIPKDLIHVSSGYYLASFIFNYDMDALLEAIDEEGALNMDYLMSHGFVNFDSWYSVRNDTGIEKGNEYLDLVAYASWIACTPLAERQDIFDNYPLVKQKYDITVSYFKKYLNMDLEAFSKEWSAVTVE